MMGRYGEGRCAPSADTVAGDTGTGTDQSLPASPCRRVVNLGAGSWALCQGHLQVQALALAYNGELDGLTWLGS